LSERVNVYLPKQLIARADKKAAEMGMNRSSFFGLALTQALALADISRTGKLFTIPEQKTKRPRKP
jgi:hypothetical protein